MGDSVQLVTQNDVVGAFAFAGECVEASEGPVRP